MMAAGRAAENGAKVLLIERNERLGVKLLITGKGRCNITNTESNLQFLTEKYGKNGRFLFSSFSRFGVTDVVDFFESRGVKTKVERGGRVFPVSDKSIDVLKALINYMNEHKVKIMKGRQVERFIQREKKVQKIVLSDGKEIAAHNFLISTGGKSYPETGSDGSMFRLLKKMGHSISDLTPALVPIICTDKFLSELEGLSLKNVNISAWQNNKKKLERFGEALFTDRGVSGPIILDMSREVGKLLEVGSVELKIDFKPALSNEVLDKRIQQDFQEFNNKMFKNSLDNLLPKKLIAVIIQLSKIDPNKKVNTITKTERKILLELLKTFSLNVKKIGGFEKAIVTAGGVDLKEVDPKTMRSKLVDNLYLAGEVLDLDGPTGGFNLQVAWSTGFVAGDSININ